MIERGTYLIRNMVNGKHYGGSAKNSFRGRWSHHRSVLNKGKGGRILQRSWDKYGANAFEFIVFEYIDDLTMLREREQHLIDLYECFGPKGLNSTPYACSTYGFKRGKEAIAKSIAAHAGKKHTAEWNANIGKGRTNKQHTAETRAKMSAALYMRYSDPVKLAATVALRKATREARNRE